jgi:hypothetical protein
MAHKKMAHRRTGSDEAARARQLSREDVRQPAQASAEQSSHEDIDRLSREGTEQLPRERRMRIRSRLQLALAFVLMGAVIAAGAFLPARIAESFDGLFLRRIEVQALVPEDEVLPVAAPLINRLKLLSAPHFELARLPLQTGGYLDDKTVRVVLDRELEELSARGLYPGHAPLTETKGVVRAEASLYVLAGQPNVNGIIWQIEFENDSLSGRICLDDESGKILSYLITYHNKIPSFDLFTEQSGERWMEYLGLDSNNLRFVEEKYDWSTDGAVPDSFAPSISLSDTIVFGKTDLSSNVIIIPTTRFRFLFEAGASPFEMYCEQFNDDVVTTVSLRIVSSKGEAGEDSPLDKLTDAPRDTSSEGGSTSSVGKLPEPRGTG